MCNKHLKGGRWLHSNPLPEQYMLQLKLGWMLELEAINEAEINSCYEHGDRQSISAYTASAITLCYFHPRSRKGFIVLTNKGLNLRK